jgi:hypothetical protein
MFWLVIYLLSGLILGMAVVLVWSTLVMAKRADEAFNPDIAVADAEDTHLLPFRPID